MSNPRVESPAKYRAEDRVFFIVLPTFLPVCIAVWLLQHFSIHPTGFLAVVFVLLFNLPFLAWMVIIALYLGEEKDEFQSALLSRAMLWGTGATLLVTILWGAMEQFSLVPIMPIRWVMPLFTIFYAIALRILRWRYR
jgi:hypothetical protein